MAIDGGVVAVGQPPERVSHEPWSFDDMRPGAFRIKERLIDMDENHVERSLCFPTMPRFCGQTFLEAEDRELALACVIAYNDWMVDEWCGESAGRLIPLCLIPLWDAQLAAAEVRRNAERGVRAVAFTELPAHLDLPTLHDPAGYWDPFLQACEDTGTVVCMHIGSSSKLMTTSTDAPMGVRYALTTLQFADVTGGLVAVSHSWLGSAPSTSRTRRARSGGCPTCSSASTDCGRTVMPATR